MAKQTPTRRRRRKKRPAGCFISLFLCGLVFGSLLYIQRPGMAAALTGPLAGVPLHSEHVYLKNLNSGEVLFTRRGTARLYPASITKVMTAIVAVEGIADLGTLITLNEAIFPPLQQAGAATAGYMAGEQVTALDLLYGLLLPSGAECGTALAEYLCGSQAGFVALMNQKAEALGMQSTHYENTSGLHDAGHYSTAADLALLLEYALENSLLREILSTGWHTGAPTNLHDGGLAVQHTFLARLGGAAIPGCSLLGGKTGYTPEAGQCLASFATINGETYLLVTCGAYGDRATEDLHIEDAIAVYTALA